MPAGQFLKKLYSISFFPLSPATILFYAKLYRSQKTVITCRIKSSSVKNVDIIAEKDDNSALFFFLV
jgi:hypothetical protein